MKKKKYKDILWLLKTHFWLDSKQQLRMIRAVEKKMKGEEQRYE